MRENISIFRAVAFSVPLTLLASPLQALAVQQHGGAEGLVAHQIGHVLFISGMAYLLYRIYNLGIRRPGWFEFKVFLWLIILWNIQTFTGHWMMEIIDHGKFIKQGLHVTEFTVTDPFDVYFYFTRLDHLLLVPSFIFLYIALRKWRRVS